MSAHSAFSHVRALPLHMKKVELKHLDEEGSDGGIEVIHTKFVMGADGKSLPF